MQLGGLGFKRFQLVLLIPNSGSQQPRIPEFRSWRGSSALRFDSAKLRHKHVRLGLVGIGPELAALAQGFPLAAQ